MFPPEIAADVSVRQFDNVNKLNHLEESNLSSRGFILVSRYYEQQIGAAMNLLTLSKWAKTVGAFPVEPFVTKSSFHNLANKKVQKNPLYFHDYFDMELWNKMCQNFSAMPLISWNTFITHNSGEYILVYNTGEKTSKLALVDDEVMNEVACKEVFSKFEISLQYYLTQTFNMTMEIVRRVCISFTNRKPLHINDFTDAIYGNLDPSNVVVWFQTWKGIMRSLRVKIIERKFARNIETFKMVQSSKRIVEDSKKYVNNVLKSDFGKYVSISFRSVKRAKYYYVKKKRSPMIFFHNCISKLQKTVDLINSSNMVFLAQDLGRFGDVKDETYLTNDMINEIENDLFQSVYKGELTIEKWEQQFINVTGGITDSGYIAAMQSEILKNSGCIIMFGGDSNFQRSVLYRYKQGHSHNDPCVHEVCYIE